MARPAMTEEQRAVAEVMLANAIRKAERFDGDGGAGTAAADLLRAASARTRADAARSYVRGMVDLLAVLFDGGRPAAEEIYANAQALARGGSAAGREDGAG